MSNNRRYEISENEKSVNNILYEIAYSFKKKYKLYPIATIVAMPGGIVKELGLDFQIIGPLSKDEIRRILINLAQEFLVFVNSDEAVRPYLENYPFEIKNIEITLFLKDSKGREIEDPHIGIAGISRGRLDYEILVITDIPKVISRVEESYEEALKALQKH